MEQIYNAAVTIKRVKMFPLFEVAHYMLTCMSVRDYTVTIQQASYRSDAQEVFSRVHPLASWVSSVLMCFAGSFIGNFLLGEPLITPLQQTNNILIVTLIWYLTNYSPFNLYTKLCKLSVVKLVLNVLKEVRRASNVDNGILFAFKVVPNSTVIPLAFGVLKGTATSHMKVVHRLICGVWQPSAIELLNPSTVTKSCIVASSLFLLHHITSTPLPLPILHLIIIIFFLITRLVDFYNIDPYKPAENLIGCLLTGGVSDSLNRALKVTNKYFNLNFSLSEEVDGDGFKVKKDD